MEYWSNNKSFLSIKRQTASGGDIMDYYLHTLTSFASNCESISEFLIACLHVCFAFTFEAAVTSYWC